MRVDKSKMRNVAYIADLLAHHPFLDVKRAVFAVADEWDEWGEQHRGREIRSTFWDAKQINDARKSGKIVTIKEKPKDKPKKPVSAFGRWYKKYEVVNTHQLSQSFGFPRTGFGEMCKNDSVGCRVETLEKIINGVAHYHEAPIEEIVLDLAAMAPNFAYHCRRLYPNLFVPAVLTFTLDGEIVQTVDLPAKAYDLLTLLSDMCINHGYELTVGG